MRKILITIAALIASAIIINFAVVLMHKDTISSAFQEGGDALTKMGGGLTYKTLSLKRFVMWDIQLEVTEPQLKYGDAHMRRQFDVDKLLITFLPFQKQMTVVLNDSVRFSQKDVFGEQKNYVYEFTAPVLLKAEFLVSLESFITGVKVDSHGGGWLKDIKDMSYEDKGFKLLEIAEGDKKLPVAESKGNTVWIVDSTEPDSGSRSTDIAITFGDYLYNAESADEEVRLMSALGSMSANVDFSYNYKIMALKDIDTSDASALPEDDATAEVSMEKIQLKDMSLRSDLFSFLVTGEGLKYGHSPNLNWEVDISIDQYKQLLDFYAELMNVSLSRVAKARDSSAFHITNDKVYQIRKLFEELPSVKIDGDAMSLSFVKKDNDMILGGVDAMAIFGKLSLILLGRSRTLE